MGGGRARGGVHVVDHFLGVERHVLGPDVLYKVFVDGGAICGLRIGGQWSWVFIKLVLLGELALFTRESVHADPRLEAAYEGRRPSGREALRGERAKMTLHMRNELRPRGLRVAASDLDSIEALLRRHAFRVDRS